MAKSQAVNLPGDAKLAHKNSEPTDQIEAELKRAMTEHFALTFIVKNRAGDIWSTTISSSSLVSDLEDQVREEAQLPPDSIVRLIHQGKILDSERTVASYNLPDGSVLYFSVGKRPPEPVKAAAPVQPEDFKSRLIKQVADEGMTMVIVTHEMGFAREVGTRILFMAEGKVLEQAPPEEFFGNPQHPRLREFLAKVL